VLNFWKGGRSDLIPGAEGKRSKGAFRHTSSGCTSYSEYVGRCLGYVTEDLDPSLSFSRVPKRLLLTEKLILQFELNRKPES
jgi:hypothetical protein